MKKKKKWILVTIVLALVVAILFLLLDSFKKNEYQVIDRVGNIEKMKKEHQEILGWIKVEGTNIDYPIVDYSSVSIENLDYDYVWKNTSTTKLEEKNTIVGHNIQNVSEKPLIKNKDHVRFEQLMGFIYYDVVKENQYIQYSIDGKNYLYKIYAVTFSTTDEEYRDSTLEDKNAKKEYIEKMRKKSLFNYDIDVDENDNLISLVTCTRMFGYENADVKFKVEGRLLRKNEKAKKYKVKSAKDYDKILGGKLL